MGVLRHGVQMAAVLLLLLCGFNEVIELLHLGDIGNLGRRGCKSGHASHQFQVATRYILQAVSRSEGKASVSTSLRGIWICKQCCERCFKARLMCLEAEAQDLFGAY